MSCMNSWNLNVELLEIFLLGLSGPDLNEEQLQIRLELWGYVAQFIQIVVTSQEIFHIW